MARQDIIREFERFPGDTGSTEVQGAPRCCMVAPRCRSWGRPCASSPVEWTPQPACLRSLLKLLLPLCMGARFATLHAMPARTTKLARCPWVRRAAAQVCACSLTTYMCSHITNVCAVALLTRKIEEMAEHMRQHRKDYSSRRHAEQLAGGMSVCCAPAGLASELVQACHSWGRWLASTCYLRPHVHRGLPAGAVQGLETSSASCAAARSPNGYAACVLRRLRPHSLLPAGAWRRCCTSGASC